MPKSRSWRFLGRSESRDVDRVAHIVPSPSPPTMIPVGNKGGVHPFNPGPLRPRHEPRADDECLRSIDRRDHPTTPGFLVELHAVRGQQVERMTDRLLVRVAPCIASPVEDLGAREDALLPGHHRPRIRRHRTFVPGVIAQDTSALVMLLARSGQAIEPSA